MKKDKQDYSGWWGEKTELFNCDLELKAVKINAITGAVQLICTAIQLLPHPNRLSTLVAAWCGAWLGVTIHRGWINWNNYRTIKAMGEQAIAKREARTTPDSKELEELKRITGME